MKQTGKDTAAEKLRRQVKELFKNFDEGSKVRLAEKLRELLEVEVLGPDLETKLEAILGEDLGPAELFKVTTLREASEVFGHLPISKLPGDL